MGARGFSLIFQTPGGEQESRGERNEMNYSDFWPSRPQLGTFILVSQFTTKLFMNPVFGGSLKRVLIYGSTQADRTRGLLNEKLNHAKPLLSSLA